MTAGEIEAIKLKAAFLNNLGVGLTLTGVLTPMLALVYRLPDWAFRIVDQDWPTSKEAMTLVAGVFTIVLALRTGKECRRRAVKLVKTIDTGEARPTAP